MKISSRLLQVSFYVCLFTTLSICYYAGTLAYASQHKSQITLIFKRPPLLSDTISVSAKSGILDGAPITLWENFSSIPIRPSAVETDTISVWINSAKVKLRHRYRAFFYSDIVLYPNDTLEISYLDDNPIFQISNRQTKLYDLALDSLLYESLYAKQQFPALLFYQTYPILQNMGTEKSGQIFDPQEEEHWALKALEEMHGERVFIDSLLDADLISEDVHAIKKDQLSFMPHVLEYKRRQISDLDVRAIIDSIANSGIDLPYSYFLNLSELFATRQLATEAPLLYHHKTAPVLQGQDSYTMLEASDIFPARIKELLLFKQVQKVAAHSSLEDFRAVFEQFANYATDTTLINAIQREYLLDFDAFRSTAETAILLLTDQKRLTLEQLVTNNKGQVLYVDFWASWCVPCRQAMPASHKLKERYKDKPIKFIYISIDRKFDDWIHAAREEGLLNDMNSFLYLNAGTSDWARQLGLQTIPRYVIFNKNGEMSYPNALGPSAAELKYILDKHLE